MPWLMRGEEVLASVEVADTARARLRGLLGRDDPAGPAGQGDAAGSAGALLLTPARAVHTCAMRFAVDVAYLRRAADLPPDPPPALPPLSQPGDRQFVVLAVARMRPWRVGRPRLRAHAVLEAAAGAFDRWSLRPGDTLRTTAPAGG